MVEGNARSTDASPGGVVSERINIRRRVVASSTLAAVVVVFTETAGRWIIADVFGLGVDPIVFVLVFLSIVIGWPARLGVAAGLLATGTLFGGWSSGVIGAVAGFVATGVVVRLWSRKDDHTRDGWPGWLYRYGTTTVATVLTFAATGAWLSEVTGRAAFSVTVGDTVVSTLPIALIGAPLVRSIIGRMPKGSRDRLGNPKSGQPRIAVIAALVGWILVGYMGSFLFRALSLAPPGSVGRRISPIFESFVSLWGWQGAHAQLLLGAVAVVTLKLLLRWE